MKSVNRKMLSLSVLPKKLFSMDLMIENVKTSKFSQWQEVLMGCCLTLNRKCAAVF